MSKPSLLYICHEMPSESGKGLTMRAGMLLEAFARDFRVFLLVIPVSGKSYGPDHPPAFVSRHCEHVAIMQLDGQEDPAFDRIIQLDDAHERSVRIAEYPTPVACRFANDATVREAAALVAGIHFDSVFVFRIFMAPFAEPWLMRGRSGRPVCLLDLDDFESRTRRRLAEMHRDAGDVSSAIVEESESKKYDMLERKYIPLFDCNFVAGGQDRLDIVSHHGFQNVVVVPNAIRLPHGHPAKRTGAPSMLLFAGYMRYVANQDAARYFCSEILPLIRHGAARKCRVVLAGAFPPPQIQALSSNPEVVVTGQLVSLDGCYRDADMAIVPLRAAGGTRIKILEAFSHRRPVVATSVGAEGLEVTHGREILIGDTPEAFAECCLRLMRDPALGEALAARAYLWVSSRHTLENVARSLRPHYAGIFPAPPGTGR